MGRQQPGSAAKLMGEVKAGKKATRRQHEAPLMTWGTSSRLEVVVNEDN